MVQRPNDDDLCTQAWEALRARLGPVETMRFLSILRNQSRDYQGWRDKHFQSESVESLLNKIKSTGTSDRNT